MFKNILKQILILIVVIVFMFVAMTAISIYDSKVTFKEYHDGVVIIHGVVKK